MVQSEDGLWAKGGAPGETRPRRLEQPSLGGRQPLMLLGGRKGGGRGGGGGWSEPLKNEGIAWMRLGLGLSFLNLPGLF